MMPDQSALQWRNLLMEVCIVPDNISSMVHAYGLRLLTSEGWHLGKGCILLKTSWSSVIWWSG